MKRILLGLMVLLATNLPAQHPWPREKSLFIGWTQHSVQQHPIAPFNALPDWQLTYKTPTISLERSLMRYGSIIFGAGLNTFERPRSHEYKKFNTQLFGELRYYFLLRRHRPTSGGYIGLYCDLDRIRWISRQNGVPMIRTSWENAGPTCGYQHAFGNHIRFNEGVMAVMQSNVRTVVVDPTTGQTHMERVYDAWYAFYWYVKLGFVF